MGLNTGQWAILIACGVLLLGYIFGYYYNRQKAVGIYAWLHQGLATLGTVTRGEKIPGMATGGRLEVNQPTPPLKSVETVYLMAPRENLLFWLFSILQRRGDELIVWITYQAKPEQSVEVARRGNRQFEKRMRDREKPALSIRESQGRLQVAAEEKPGAREVDRVRSLMRQYPSSVVRLALRPEKPHLFLRINLRIMQHVKAEELFNVLKQLVG